MNGLFLGNKNTAKSIDFFKNNQINYVLNCSSDLPFIDLPDITFKDFP